MSIPLTSSIVDTVGGDLTARKKQVRHLRWNGLSVISASKQNLTGPVKSGVVSGTYDTSRVRHRNLTGKDVSHVAMVFCNFAPASGTEVANANALTVKAALEDLSPIGPNTQDQPRHPMETLGGGHMVLAGVNVDRRAVLITKPVPHYLAPNADFFTVIGATPASGTGQFPRGGCQFGSTSGWATDNGEGTSAGSDRVNDGSTAISANLTSYYYSESAVLGRLSDGTIGTSVCIGGDSIEDGVDDAGQGGPYIGGIGRRLFATTPHLRISIPGEKLGDIFDTLTVVNGPTKNFYARAQLLALCTHVFSTWGRNDCEQYATYGGGTVSTAVAQFKANLLLFAKWCMMRGQHFKQATILPAPTSTDGFTTTINQSISDANKESVRTQINAWLMDASVSGFVAQANAQVAGVLYPGQAFALDRCAPIECNAAGALTSGGGRILAATVAVNGTATSGTTTTLVDSGKAWTTNAYKGFAVYIVSGTGAGQMRCVAYNNGTTLTVNNSFSPAPDLTSVYQIIPALGMNGVHPFSKLHDLIAADATVIATTSQFLAAL